MNGTHTAEDAINTTPRIALEALDCDLSICKLAELPENLFGNGLCFVARTDEELSVVCETTVVPSETLAREDGWRALKVRGPLDFALIGIMAKISTALANAHVGLFAVSTFDTDYVLVKKEQLETAIAALRAAGCEI